MSESVSVKLPVTPDGTRQAREALEPFRARLDPDSYNRVCLLATELVIEALIAEDGAGTRLIALEADIRNENLHLEVQEGAAAYQLTSLPEPGERGWGVRLVSRLSRRWGIRREPDHASVWLEVPVTSSSAGAAAAVQRPADEQQ